MDRVDYEVASRTQERNEVRYNVIFTFSFKPEAWVCFENKFATFAPGVKSKDIR